MEKNKFVVWSDTYPDLGEWEGFLVEECEIREKDRASLTDAEAYDMVYDYLQTCLDEGRKNLDIDTRGIVVIGDIGTWKGRKTGYKEIKGGNIKDCLYDEACDQAEWYVDEEGDFCFTGHHHDGTNHYLYRELKEGVETEDFEDAFFSAKKKADVYAAVEKLTVPLGWRIAAVYGWELKAA